VQLVQMTRPQDKLSAVQPSSIDMINKINETYYSMNSMIEHKNDHERLEAVDGNGATLPENKNVLSYELNKIAEGAEPMPELNK
jgi:hypothetical protein